MTTTALAQASEGPYRAVERSMRESADPGLGPYAVPLRTSATPASAGFRRSMAVSHKTVGIRKAPGRGCVQVAIQFVVDCDACQMEQRISLVTLGVSDLARARSFYEAMGWGGAQQPDEEVCFFQAGGMVLGLWTALGGHGAPGIELAQNVRAPEEVAVVLAEAEQAGGKIVRPAARAEWGGMSGAFADPDGYVWEVAHNPGWTITDDGSIRI
jgi:predicted enzyme related to lactoylglutathione lyase